MNNYEDLPCSLFLPRQPVENHHHQPRVVENLTPQKPPEEAPVAVKKKSCLSSANSRKDLPAHPALHRKTVAFGRTVNVSQTVEGTSRTSKKMATSSATSSPAQKTNENGNEECQEDWRKLMKDELETMKREMQEETAKRQEALNNQNLNKMQEMMSQFFQQIAVAKQPANEEKENVHQTRTQEKPKPVNKVSIARQIIKKEGRIPPEAIPFLERRIQTDPIFRQQVDDVLADAEYDLHKDSYSPPPPPLSEARYGASGNPAMMRETLTVERSIRYDNGLASLDSRQWTKERTDGRNQEQWRNYEPDPILHSTYQPGNSVSYYPSAVDRARNNRGYYVEHTSDQEDDVGEFEDPQIETAAERERRIREKYARRK